jgi:hypothetical protein
MLGLPPWLKFLNTGPEKLMSLSGHVHTSAKSLDAPETDPLK